MDKIRIRESGLEDKPSLDTLYPAAFPNEDLLPLVEELLREPEVGLSLVAVVGADVVGHVIFTACGIADTEAKVSLLGPLAVNPSRQRRGVGSRLVRAGFERAGATQVFVLGDPAYYGRFGFSPDALVAPPYPLPEAWIGAWQSKRLAGCKPGLAGTLTVPRPWRRSSLWTE